MSAQTGGAVCGCRVTLVVSLQALAYFEQLKESQDAWEVCADALAKGVYR